MTDEVSGGGRPAPGPDRPLVEALVVLSFTSGLIDAIGLLGLAQSFLAVMTGNLVLLGVGAVDPAFGFAGPVVALAAFIAGAALFARLDEERAAPEGRHLLLTRIITIEVTISLVCTLLAIGYETTDEVRKYLITALIAGGMGARNVAVRRIKIPELRTTVQTLALAGLTADTVLGKRSRSDALMLIGITAMIAGALAGALLVDRAAVVWALATLTAVQGTALLILLDRRRRGSPHLFT